MRLTTTMRQLAADCLVFAAGQSFVKSSVRFYGLIDMWAGRSQTAGGGPAAAVVNSGGMQMSYGG